MKTYSNYFEILIFVLIMAVLISSGANRLGTLKVKKDTEEIKSMLEVTAGLQMETFGEAVCDCFTGVCYEMSPEMWQYWRGEWESGHQFPAMVKVDTDASLMSDCKFSNVN